MSLNPKATLESPPLSSAWRLETQLNMAVTGNSTLYGIRGDGRLAAFSAADGSQRWECAQTYLPTRIVRQNNRLFAFQESRGLAYIDDLGTSTDERLMIGFRATLDANIAAPVLDDRWLYLAINQGVYVVDQDDGLQYAAVMESTQPFGVALAAPREVVVIDGYGIPARYRVGATAFQLVWTGRPHGLDVGIMERPFIVAGTRLILGLNEYTVAYNLSNGTIAWILASVPARVFAVQGENVYAAGQGAAVWKIRASDGAILWQRQYIHNRTLQQGAYGLITVGDQLYFGGVLDTNPDGVVLLAIKGQDGSFTWHSRSVALTWSGGVPITDGTRLYAFGGSHTGAYTALSATPQVTTQLVETTPRPLRGPASGFGSGRVRVNLPVTAHVSLAPYREAQGLGAPAILRANWGVGLHDTSWTPSGAGGFTDAAQFGYMLIDVEENSGASYTQAQLIPVNAFPDVMSHWARHDVEVMIYHQYVSGYPDQTFKPDNLVTRAESSTIIAKTLGLTGPSPSFRTKFTDIQTHWARDAIMALEERGVIGGFAEPDGTFTFRPDLNMTRGQEARILVNAYAIASAPAGFETRFTDIAGHWAANDIKALEAAGYVQGFHEADGTYTYRPEQNLTRAEMCAIVVRIRNLSR